MNYQVRAKTNFLKTQITQVCENIFILKWQAITHYLQSTKMVYFSLSFIVCSLGTTTSKYSNIIYGAYILNQLQNG